MSDTLKTPKAPKTNGASNSIDRKITDQKVDEERKLLQKFQNDLELKTKLSFSKEDMSELVSAIAEQKKLFDATFSRRKERYDREEKSSNVAKKIAQDLLLRNVPAARKIVKLNTTNINQLDKLFHGFDNGRFNSDHLHNLEVAIADLLDYEEFHAPYDFSEINAGDENFEFDGSYAIPDWGIFGNDVTFEHEHDYGDIDLSFESSRKYAFTTTGIGKIYKMPKAGLLDLTLVVRNLSNDINYDIDDYFGPSNSYLDMENIFFVSVRGQSGGHLHSVYLIDETRSSNGGSITTIPQGQLYTLNFRTADSFVQGEDIKILLASYLRILSYAYLVRNRVNATINWHLEKIYVKVV
jgi:hypothetical protein